MLTKAGAKLLDFGLAKLKPTGPQSDASTKLADNLTEQGTILGTFQYMAPEQLNGEEVDARTDLFAFGAVVYEMLTGTKAFEGKTQASLIAAIMSSEPPPPSSIEALSPAGLDYVVQTCLGKDRDDRWQSARDLVRELKRVEAGSVTLAASSAAAALPQLAVWQRPMPLLVASLLMVGITGLTVWRLVRPDLLTPAGQGLTRLSLDVYPGQHLSGGLAMEDGSGFALQRPSRQSFVLSPDGRGIVYAASDGESTQLYRRPMDQAQAIPIPETEGGSNPFFSPDGRSVGFFVEGQLKRFSMDGGEVRTIAVSGPELIPFGAHWTTADTLLVSAEDAIYEVPSSGGDLSRVTSAEPDPGELFLFPEMLPGGQAVLFNIGRSASPSEWNIVVESLDTGQRHVVVERGSDPRYVSSGHILFVRTGVLMAVPFDVTRLEGTGAPIVVVEDVMHAERGSNSNQNTGAGQFSVSRSGSLAYVPGGLYPIILGSLVLVDHTGTSEPLPLPPGRYLGPRFSPDGTRLAYAEGPTGESQIWVYDIGLEVPVRLTTAGSNMYPVWSPDGTRLAFVSTREEGARQLFWMAADGSGQPQRLAESDASQNVSSWSPDGVLAFLQTVSVSGALLNRDI